MKQKRWFLVPRNEATQVQRSHNLAPLVERLRQLAQPQRSEPRVKPKNAPKWYEQPRRRA
jgi:hypothetical protein